jgi:hypothetical protein
MKVGVANSRDHLDAASQYFFGGERHGWFL